METTPQTAILSQFSQKGHATPELYLPFVFFAHPPSQFLFFAALAIINPEKDSTVIL
jgi:hypothetical protein